MVKKVFDGGTMTKFVFSCAISKLNNIILPSETPIYATNVFVYKNSKAKNSSLSFKNKKPYVICITDKRLLFCMKEGTKSDLFDIALSKIQDVNQKTNNITQYQITIETLKEIITIDCTNKNIDKIYMALRSDI